jgi:hypothetical protein
MDLNLNEAHRACNRRLKEKMTLRRAHNYADYQFGLPFVLALEIKKCRGRGRERGGLKTISHFSQQSGAFAA